MKPRGKGVLVADDDALARRVVVGGLASVGADRLLVEAQDAAQTRELAREDEIGLVILEPRIFRSRDLVEFLRELDDLDPPPRVLIFTGDARVEVCLDALRAGACGVAYKDEGMDDLISAVDRALSGSTVLPGALVMELISQLSAWSGGGPGTRPVRSDLTAREWEILDHLAAGASTQAIADALVVSVHTVYSHIKNLMQKLEVHTRQDAVAAAFRERDGAVGGTDSGAAA